MNKDQLNVDLHRLVESLNAIVRELEACRDQSRQVDANTIINQLRNISHDVRTLGEHQGLSI